MWPAESQVLQNLNQFDAPNEIDQFEMPIRNRHITRYSGPQVLILEPIERSEPALSIRPVFVQFGHHYLEI